MARHDGEVAEQGNQRTQEGGRKIGRSKEINNANYLPDRSLYQRGTNKEI
jgi:hypothetical protein